MARLATFASRVEADLMRARLAAQGIDARVEADDVGGAYPWLQSGGVGLIVEDDVLAAAQGALSNIEAPPMEAPGDLEAAELAANAMRPRGTEGNGSGWVNVAILLAIGGLMGYVLGRSEVLAHVQSTLAGHDHPGLESQETETVELDENGDGRIDSWAVYRGSEIERWMSDRNADGSPDSWQTYEAGLVGRSEDDDDFDGKTDRWYEYRGGVIVRSKFDGDGNGLPDGTTEYVHGVAVRGSLHPNGGPVEEEERYVDGLLREVYAVAPDGTSKRIRTYDAWGREIGRPDPQDGR